VLKEPQIFEYCSDSVNAMNVPLSLKGFRTQFNSFHHFKLADATLILHNVVHNNQPIGIFEVQQINIKNLLGRLLSSIC
jgi:hypothetical protein